MVRLGFFSLISFILMCSSVWAGSLNWTAYSITQTAPYLESSCYDSVAGYLSTCSNTNWNYANATAVATGTTTSLNYNWGSGNISIGGTLSHFAAPPVLMVAGVWKWSMGHMITHFGYKAAISIVIGTFVISYNCQDNVSGNQAITKYRTVIVQPDYSDEDNDGYDDASYIAGLEEGILVGGQSGDSNGDGTLDILDIVYFIDVILYP